MTIRCAFKMVWLSRNDFVFGSRFRASRGNIYEDFEIYRLIFDQKAAGMRVGWENLSIMNKL